MKARSPQDADSRSHTHATAPLGPRTDGPHPVAGPLVLPFPVTAASPAPTDHELTVVVPAYNEASRLPQTLDGLTLYLEQWGIDYRVLVVDDGSSDGTARLVEGRGPRVSAISQSNGGKGSAVRNGMLRATGRVIAFTDADLPYELSALRQGYETIASQQAHVALGARDLADSQCVAQRRFLRSVAHEVFRQLMRLLVSRQVGDTQCGLKIFSRPAAREIFSRCTIDGFAFDAEVVYLLHALGLSYCRLPVVLVNEYATTISLSRHALPMLWDVVQMRWRALRGEYATVLLNNALLAAQNPPVASPPTVARPRSAA